MDNINITSVWKSQPIPEQKPNTTEFVSMANSRIKYSFSKHKITTGILIIVLFLLVCFVLKADYSGIFFYTGMGLMMIALLLRIVLEWYSFVLLKKTDLVNKTLKYLHQLEVFFNKRRSIHRAYTIITVSLYVVGFAFLLPVFYKELPFSLFLYIAISFMVVCIILIIFLRKKVMKELEGLKQIIVGLQNTIDSLSKEE